VNVEPRLKLIAGLIEEVSKLEDQLEGFEAELAQLSSASAPSPPDEELRSPLEETVAELARLLSQKRSELQALAAASTGCSPRTVSPLRREWIEEEEE
jgi:hypothetical protein